MDCGGRVLVSFEKVWVHEVEDTKDAEDSKSAQQQHQEKETKGHGVTMDQEPHGRKEERSEEGEKGGQEETVEPWKWGEASRDEIARVGGPQGCVGGDLQGQSASMVSGRDTPSKSGQEEGGPGGS